MLTAAVCARAPLTLRHYMVTAMEDEVSQVQLFMNSVPLLSNLSNEQKLQLIDAFVEEVFEGNGGGGGGRGAAGVLFEGNR